MRLTRVVAVNRAERGVVLKHWARALGSAVLGISSDHLRVAFQMPSGRPVLMVGDTVSAASLSFSHLDHVVAVAIDDEHSVGIDLVQARDAQSLESWTARAGSDDWCDPSLSAYSWAAREAAFKAAAIDRPFRPDDFQIRLTGDQSFRWSAVGAGDTVSGDGQFERRDAVICAIAVRRACANRGAIHD